jgi:hypothetical protein
VAAGSGSLGALVFIVGMTIGMLVEQALARLTATRAQPHLITQEPS